MTAKGADMNETNHQEQPEETPKVPPSPQADPPDGVGGRGYARLGVISFGLATGATFALFVFFLGIMAAFFEWGMVLAATLSSFLIGFGPSFVGSIAGAVWAFVIGFLLGLLDAWLYNRFLVRRRHGSP